MIKCAENIGRATLSSHKCCIGIKSCVENGCGRLLVTYNFSCFPQWSCSFMQSESFNFSIYYSYSYFLLSHWRNARLAKMVCTAMFLATFSLVFAIGIHTDFLLSHDVLFSLGDEMYVRPWARIFPYLVGVYFAWYFCENKSKINCGKVRRFFAAF